MSFTVTGTTFTAESATQHANETLAYVNGLLQGLGLPVLIPTNDNALWWTILGTGSLQQIYDTALLQASQSFNPSLCDDNQILNMLPLAGTQLIGASPTTLSVTATANGVGSCVIPNGMNFSVHSVAYALTSGCTILASGNATLPAQCLSNGPNIVLANEVTASSITTPFPANLLTFTNSLSGVPGRYQETPAQVRTRVLNKATKAPAWDQCQVALNNLAGVSLASVFFNPSSTNNLTLTGGVVLPPRNAYIVLAGTNLGIAATYWSHLSSPTSGSNLQNYTTLSNQVLGVYWDNPISQPVYTQIYIDSTKPLGTGYQAEAIALLESLNGSLLPGQSISSELVLSAIASAQQSTIVGALVGTTATGYYQRVSMNVNSVPFFSSNTSITTFVSI